MTRQLVDVLKASHNNVRSMFNTANGLVAALLDGPVVHTIGCPTCEGTGNGDYVRRDGTIGCVCTNGKLTIVVSAEVKRG